MEKVKEMMEKKSSHQNPGDTIVYPSNKPHYCVPWCFFLWTMYENFWKISFMENKK